jgi:hypothetical protein
MFSNRLIHIHIPRTGGQKIRSIIFEKRKSFDFLYRDSHKSLQECLEILKQKHPGVAIPLSFCTVRNPWSWYVSRYFFRKMEKNKPEKPIYIESFENNKEGFQKHMYVLQEHIKNKTRVQTGIRIWGYCNTISEYYSSLTYPNVDFIGKLENFAEDVSNILAQIAPDIFKNTKENLSYKMNESMHKSYQHYYNDELIQMVSDWDAEFIKQFNYRF